MDHRKFQRPAAFCCGTPENSNGAPQNYVPAPGGPWERGRPAHPGLPSHRRIAGGRDARAPRKKMFIRVPVGRNLLKRGANFRAPEGGDST